jgi:hypothetical protein
VRLQSLCRSRLLRHSERYPSWLLLNLRMLLAQHLLYLVMVGRHLI